MKRFSQFLIERTLTTDEDYLKRWFDGDNHSGPVGTGPSVRYQDLRNPNCEHGRRMTEVLKKRPVYRGDCYRGVSLNQVDFANLLKAGYSIKLHSSASTEYIVGRDFAEINEEPGLTPVVLVIRGAKAADMRDILPEEVAHTAEVVLLAGTRLRYVSHSTEKHARFMRGEFQRVVVNAS